MAAVIVEPEIGTRLPGRATFEPLARQLLEPCPRNVADSATVIRKRLKTDLGRWQAEAVLSCYNEACLRHQSHCGRYFVDHAGRTLRLRTPIDTEITP
jgi:hypothetical protein